MVPLSQFFDAFGSVIELSSVALGGRIVDVSDEFFAAAHHLLLVGPAPSLKGQYGPNGALYNGWETQGLRRPITRCTIKLGSAGTIVGFDVDTSHFNGNEVPEVSVDALHWTDEEESGLADAQWTEILPKVPLGPSSRHLYIIPETTRYNYVRLNAYPDGGIARFRVYGNVAPVQPADDFEPFDLAHVFAGGRVVFTSDQHFGVGSNLILPGRGDYYSSLGHRALTRGNPDITGKDMSDGWETKRSRQSGHKDWAIIKLGARGRLQTAEIDTADFKGNFPESCELHAIDSVEDVPDSYNPDWVTVLPRVKLGPHRRHFFQLEAKEGAAFTHVKLTIYPDGGIKRVRIIGTRDEHSRSVSMSPASCFDGNVVLPQVDQKAVKGKVIPVLPLTHEAFAPFGQVIQAYCDHTTAPPGTKITPANGGTASKFHKLALIASSYPEGSRATTGLSVYRCRAAEVVNGVVELKVLERHPYTNQAFIPMGNGSLCDEALKDPGNTYLVVVAHNGEDDKPDMSTLRAFIATAAQGVMYSTGVWHQPMTVLEKAMDFTCLETQIGNGDKADCEILELDGTVQLRLP
ncbi:hypothetical protein ID866_1419 [Astraeus odoratus]|nr:hypothetical protein ID866_1419 [Astraeus odoratus]